MTVEAYATDWLRRRTWAPATHERIERELRLHILPALGPRPLATLRRPHLEEWAKGLPLAASSARMVFETLSNRLSAAVEDERIPRNPAKGARVAKAEDAPVVPLTADEVRMLAASTVDRVRVIVDETLTGSAEDWLRTEAV